MGYLICKKCKGRYDLQQGELPEEFESCSCGGELEFHDSGGQKKEYHPASSRGEDIYYSSGADVIRLLIVGTILLFGIFLALIMLMFFSVSTTTGGKIFSITVLIVVLIIDYSLFRVLLRTLSRLMHS